VPVHELSRVEARRIAVRAQLLDRRRPTDLLDLVRHLTLLQLEPTAAVAPSADVVAWSRLGSSYSPGQLERALGRGDLVELYGRVRPAADLALYRADMADWPGRAPLTEWQEELQDWVDANNACRLDILDRLRHSGPLLTSELPDSCAVPWRSTGWTNSRNVSQLLQLMVRRGEVALVGRGRAGEREWDLAERVYPDDPVVPAEEARRLRDERRLRALGVARGGWSAHPGDTVVGEAGEPAVVAGVRGNWRVDPGQLGRPFAGRAALLSPLDRLVFDRKRMVELFEFDYQLEMYKPAGKRRWGYWAMPVLYGDRLVGKLDATADRAAGVLRVDAIHRDVTFSKTMAAAVRREIADLARWLGLGLDLPD
jgi:hypothetical protein